MAYKGMSVEASCRKYFDALAKQLALFYKFKWGPDGDNSFPTIGDVIKAYENNTWKFNNRQKTLIERTDELGFVQNESKQTKVPKLPIPLPALFNEKEWKKLKELNRKTNERIHDAFLPKLSGKFFIILPHAEFNDETVLFFKKIGVKGKLFPYEDDLLVKDEWDLSGSSGSETSSPDKEKKL